VTAAASRGGRGGVAFAIFDSGGVFGVGAPGQGLTLVPISAQLELTLPLSAQL